MPPACLTPTPLLPLSTSPATARMLRSQPVGAGLRLHRHCATQLQPTDKTPRLRDSKPLVPGPRWKRGWNPSLPSACQVGLEIVAGHLSSPRRGCGAQPDPTGKPRHCGERPLGAPSLDIPHCFLCFSHTPGQAVNTGHRAGSGP